MGTIKLIHQKFAKILFALISRNARLELCKALSRDLLYKILALVTCQGKAKSTFGYIHESLLGTLELLIVNRQVLHARVPGCRDIHCTMSTHQSCLREVNGDLLSCSRVAKFNCSSISSIVSTNTKYNK